MFWERDWLCEVVFQCCFSLQETFDGLIQSFFPFKRNSAQRNISQEPVWNKASTTDTLLICAWLKYTESYTQHRKHIHSLCVAADDAEDGIGICGWLLTTLSWLIVLVTLPFSLCVCFKVIPRSHLSRRPMPKCPGPQCQLHPTKACVVLYRWFKNMNEQWFSVWDDYFRAAQKDQARTKWSRVGLFSASLFSLSSDNMDVICHCSLRRGSCENIMLTVSIQITFQAYFSSCRALKLTRKLTLEQ